MAANTRSSQQREHDRERIAELVLRGHSQRQIADELRVCQQQVCYDMKLVYDRWRAAEVRNLDAHRQRLLAGSELRKGELYGALERSKRERKSTTTRQRKLPSVSLPDADTLPPDAMPSLVQFPGANGHAAAERIEREARVRLEERDPDVRYIDAIRKEDEFQAQLLGLVDEPPTRDAGEPVRHVVVSMERQPDGQGEEPPGEHVIEVAPGICRQLSFRRVTAGSRRSRTPGSGVRCGPCRRASVGVASHLNEAARSSTESTSWTGCSR